MEKRNSMILIPSYQPEETLILLSKGLKDRGFEILIVDDGSGEKYAHIFEKAKEYATVIGYEVNQGKGFALKHGFKYTLENFKQYKGVITADGDGQHRILDIVAIGDKLDATNATVIGDRSFEVKIPFKSKIGNVMSQFTQTIATRRYLHDNQCGLRAFLISDLEELIKIGGNRYEYEMRVITHIQQREIPYTTMRVQTIYEENNRTTHFRPVMDTILIQSSILLSGLVNVIAFIVEALAAFLFLMFLFKDPSFGLRVEASVLFGFLTALVFRILLMCIIFRPRYPAKTILRIVLYQLLLFIATLISVVLFVEYLHLHILLTYFISILLCIIPLFYIVKGVGVVYEAQHE